MVLRYYDTVVLCVLLWCVPGRMLKCFCYGGCIAMYIESIRHVAYV